MGLKIFDGIKFDHTVTKKPLLSKNITPEMYKEKSYDPENLLNSEFVISGRYDSFPIPPITSFALENLLYAQSFGIFDYDTG